MILQGVSTCITGPGTPGTPGRGASTGSTSRFLVLAVHLWLKVEDALPADYGHASCIQGPGMPNLQRLCEQPPAEYVFLACKGLRPVEVELYMCCSSLLCKWLLERGGVDQPLVVGNDLGAHEVSLRCIGCCVCVASVTAGIFVSKYPQGQEAAACSGSKGGHLGPCSINSQRCETIWPAIRVCLSTRTSQIQE